MTSLVHTFLSVGRQRNFALLPSLLLLLLLLWVPGRGKHESTATPTRLLYNYLVIIACQRPSSLSSVSWRLVGCLHPPGCTRVCFLPHQCEREWARSWNPPPFCLDMYTWTYSPPA